MLLMVEPHVASKINRIDYTCTVVNCQLFLVHLESRVNTLGHWTRPKKKSIHEVSLINRQSRGLEGKKRGWVGWGWGRIYVLREIEVGEGALGIDWEGGVGGREGGAL